MSVQSVLGRSFSSPFSHVDLFGRELPSCPALPSVKSSDTMVLSASCSVVEKSKSKRSKAKRKSHSTPISHITVATRPSHSKKKGNKKSSKVSLDQGHKSKSSTSRAGIMAPVDCDRAPILVRQPIVRRDTIEGGVPLKTQITENDKTKTRYSRGFSEPSSASALSPGALSDSKRVPSIGEERMKNGEGLLVPNHLKHTKLSTSAYILKLTSSSSINSSSLPSATSLQQTSATGSNSFTSTYPTSSTSSRRPPPTFPSSSHGSVNASKVNVRLNTRPLGAKPHRTYTTKSQLDRGGSGVINVEEIVRGLKRMQFQEVIVLSGAGISTASGIPDFRTPGTGLYDNLQQYDIPDPTAIFDIAYFSRSPRAFCTLAKELYPGRYRPNLAHYFVRLLQEKRILLRNYTQNIDGLERTLANVYNTEVREFLTFKGQNVAGIQAGKLVEAHGSFSTASCIQCKTKQDPKQVKACILEGKVPRCKHKHCYALVKPDIVFFGEDLPDRFHALQARDFSKCDLLIVMGTSLEVEPFASLASLTRPGVPRLLLNRELVGPFKLHRRRLSDYAITGDLVESVRELAHAIGWEGLLTQLQEGGPRKLERPSRVTMTSSLGSTPSDAASTDDSVSTCDQKPTEQLLSPQQQSDWRTTFEEEVNQSLNGDVDEKRATGESLSDHVDSPGEPGKERCGEPIHDDDELASAFKELNIKGGHKNLD